MYIKICICCTHIYFNYNIICPQDIYFLTSIPDRLSAFLMLLYFLNNYSTCLNCKCYGKHVRIDLCEQTKTTVDMTMEPVASTIHLLYIYHVHLPRIRKDNFLASPGCWSRFALLHGHEIAHIGKNCFEIRHVFSPAIRSSSPA